MYSHSSRVVVEDGNDVTEMFDVATLTCNANQTLVNLERPTFPERYTLSSIRHGSELHILPVVDSDSSVLPDNEVKPLETRNIHIEQYVTGPDNYEITYIMHHQQPWANRSDRPCLVSCNPTSHTDQQDTTNRWWFQHIVHDVRQIAWLIHLFPSIQAKQRAWHCGAQTVDRPMCVVLAQAGVSLPPGMQRKQDEIPGQVGKDKRGGLRNRLCQSVLESRGLISRWIGIGGHGVEAGDLVCLADRASLQSDRPRNHRIDLHGARLAWQKLR